MTNWREKLRLKKAVLPDPRPQFDESHIKQIEMDSYKQTRHGVMESIGFKNCSGLLIYNEATGITTGFHINNEFTKRQIKKLAKLGKEPGKKHAVLFHGTYCDYAHDYQKIIRQLQQIMNEKIPGIHHLDPIVVTKMPFQFSKDPNASWECIYNAGTCELLITEVNPFYYSDKPIHDIGTGKPLIIDSFGHSPIVHSSTRQPFILGTDPNGQRVARNAYTQELLVDAATNQPIKVQGTDDKPMIQIDVNHPIRVGKETGYLFGDCQWLALPRKAQVSIFTPFEGIVKPLVDIDAEYQKKHRIKPLPPFQERTLAMTERFKKTFLSPETPPTTPKR